MTLRRSLCSLLLLCSFACNKNKPNDSTAPSSSAAVSNKPASSQAASGGAPAAAPVFTPAAGPKDVTLAEATAGLPASGKLMAEISTDFGTMTCELLPDAAPQTVASFVGLARGIKPFRDPLKGQWMTGPFFDGLLFHRVMPKFMIQGGDPLSRDPSSEDVGTGGPGYTLPDEVSPDLKFDRPGRMAMANTGPHTHSGGSQFFITEVPYPSLDGGYVIFGQCDGIDNVEKVIARVPAPGTKPARPVSMHVKILKK
jgi:peptidyl-prolyl cis-trans isomerase A (cyclophilin A)